MKYALSLSTKVYQEPECIKNHPEAFVLSGKKAFIITGRHSAKACGALEDVLDVLKENKIEYCIFDEVENNPSVETIEAAGKIGKKENVDFVVGIGGGSPLDAAKAIAVLCSNDFPAIDIFKASYDKVLPVIAVPTTSGTGSEVTPYAVFLRKDIETKMGIANPKVLPSYALLDAKYTAFMSHASTVSTAVDAFTHNLEGYLANRSQALSDVLALEGIRLFSECIDALAENTMTMEEREKLMFASMLGGAVITHTGVTLPHGMGYCYTYYKDIPHGKANGLLIEEYLKYNAAERRDKINHVLEIMHCTDIEAVGSVMTRLLGTAPKLTQEEVLLYTEQTMRQAKSIENTAHKTTKEDIYHFWTRMAE